MESNDERLQHYMEMGVIELAGVDEEGEMVFAIHETAKDLAPELWEAHSQYVDKTLIDLYEAGYLKVEYDENLEAMISLNEDGIRIAKAKGILPVELPETPNN